MKRHALAALIASLFVLTACGRQAAEQPAGPPAAAASGSGQKAGAQTPQGELPVMPCSLPRPTFRRRLTAITRPKWW